MGGLQRRQNRRFEVGGPAVKDEPAYARSFSGASDFLYDKGEVLEKLLRMDILGWRKGML